MELAFRIIDWLRLEATPDRMASAFVLGMAAGFIPTFTLHGAILLLLLFILKVHFATAVLSFLFFTMLGHLALTGLFHQLGNMLLAYPPFDAAWAWLFHAPIFPFTRFYNTVVMGSLIATLICAIPVYFVFKIQIARLIQDFPRRIADSRFRTSRFYRYYVDYRKNR